MEQEGNRLLGFVEKRSQAIDQVIDAKKLVVEIDREYILDELLT